ncbi:MAG TPA: arsenic resistance N-acetyltransferase ArsN2 [Longimicrobiales bacterium]
MREIPVVRPATAGDHDAVCRLLTDNDLPLDGLHPSLKGFAVAEVGGMIVGACGVERAGDYGLLRSAVVDDAWRGLGVGKALVEEAIASAMRRNLKSLYLLTTTAAEWFPAFGFVPAAREDAPPAIQRTKEFTDACPATATMLRMTLPPSPEIVSP